MKEKGKINIKIQVENVKLKIALLRNKHKKSEINKKRDINQLSFFFYYFCSTFIIHQLFVLSSLSL